MTELGPRIRHDLVKRIREIENVFIPMSDGCRIAARVWLPKDAGRKPVPAILEYIPYRKRDFMRERDEPIHRYFAGHGYAAVRVDVRGSGDSEGVLRDEYSREEHRDALEVLKWIADQPWCDGSVGMMGISWGGFNALQVAALRPPELRAVISLCASDDRYADDAHYMGGCLLNENLQWGAILSLYNALPPDPSIVGERWKTMWHERLENAVAFPELWMLHPWRDEYWKYGSVSEDYSAIECPVYAIGGWADGYSNAVPRLLAGLSCPRKGLVGPWAHTFPHAGIPGPRIGFLQEAIRWWDHWMLGRDTGIMDEPLYRVWMQESVPPQPQYETRPGRWVAEAAWPSARIEPRRFSLQPGRLEPRHAAADGQDSPGEREPGDVAPDVNPEVTLTISSPQSTGLVAGDWCAFGADGEMPLGQRSDDGRSLVFDSDALGERLEILGAASLELELSSSAPVALVAARLNDVAPDGASTRVTYGLLNLTHRQGHERPEPLEPGRRYRIRVQLNDIAHAFPPGHRLRVALSTSYWPIAWPPPEPVTLAIVAGSSTLALPIRQPDPADASLRPFDSPERAPGTKHAPLRPLPFRRSVERDLTTDEFVYTLKSDGGEFGDHSLARLEAIDMELGYTLVKRHRITARDPLSAKSELTQSAVLRRDGWAVRLQAVARLVAERDHLRFTASLEASEGEKQVFKRDWDTKIPRLLF